MSPRIPSPLGQLADLPVELVAALRAVPTLVEHTEEMRRNTAVLRQVADGMQGVSRDTEALPAMDRRMANIEEAMPVLVEVQQHLAQLPETMDKLDARIGELAELLQRMLGALGHLDESVTSLHAAVEPLGRVADRLPGSSKRG